MISTLEARDTQLTSEIPLTAILADTPATDRRRLAQLIRRRRVDLLDEWTERHQRYPLLSEHVIRELGSWLRYRSAYLAPLLFLLARALRTGTPEFFYLYAAERTRFLSQEQLPEGSWDELEPLLAGDRASLLALTAGDADRRVRLASILNSVDAGILRRDEGRLLQIGLIGDCLMTEVRPFLKPTMAAQGVELASSHHYFSARMGYDFNLGELESLVSTRRFDLLALSFFTFEGIPPYTGLLREADHLSGASLATRCGGLLSLVDSAIAHLRAVTDAPILLHGCSGLPLSRTRQYLPVIRPLSRGQTTVAAVLDDGLKTLADGTENVIFVDEQAIVSAVGLRRANRRLIPRRVTHGTTIHYSAIGGLLATRYRSVIESYLALGGAKVILVDFDNTLWTGVMAEGEVEHHVERQHLLKELQRAGILLVSLSKNDPESIRWTEMALVEDDFALHKISWQPKAQSVAEAAHQLHLDPSAFVFIDDNPVERELVTAQFSSVVAMDGDDPATWDRLKMMLSFPNTRQTAEAEARTAMYREAAQRRQAITGELDYPSMMKSLRLKVEWRRARKADLRRAHELLSRTNQFNTTTMRLTLPALAALMEADDHAVHIATLSDKFGNLGIVGLVITRCDGDELVYESVVMSCRAMGFGLESLLVRGPMDEAGEAKRAVGRFVATERNSPCASLFREAGFAQQDGGEWTLDLGSAVPMIPDWLNVERG